MMMKGGTLTRMIAAEIRKAGGRPKLQWERLSTLSSEGTGTAGGGVSVGQIFIQKGGFSADDVQAYAHLTGDSNPIHVSTAAARAAGFDACVVPGMLCASLFPAIIGSRFAGAVYVSQDLRFKAPLLVGEPFRAEVEVRMIVKLRQHAKVTFSTRCLRDVGENSLLVVNGEAVALVP